MSKRASSYELGDITPHQKDQILATRKMSFCDVCLHIGQDRRSKREELIGSVSMSTKLYSLQNYK
jgi:hypothetical protein